MSEPVPRVRRGAATRKPWHRLTRAVLLAGRSFVVYGDEVITPAGTSSRYEWVDAPDQVRVAALTDADEIHLVDQYHYLPQRVLSQLIGGSVDAGEDPATAAARELSEEAGMIARTWTPIGVVWPLPGLTAARVHLWLAQGLDYIGAHPEPAEADLVVRKVPLARAVQEVLDGEVACAASAQLILTLARSLSTPEEQP